MTEFGRQKDAIMTIMRSHPRNNPIKHRDLAKEIGVDERMVRELVSDIVCAGDMAIGGATREPYGYYEIKTTEELDAVKADLTSRMAELNHRIKGMQEAFDRNIGVQGDLFDVGKKNIAELKKSLTSLKESA